ncbi:protein NRT1/ PTR FAMILY 5.5-like isoform X2 [Quercus robur]|uniref:protein NRT1/ PTR FAMILY 5.5-like isoform X2 n=1 Tax=Quercus robur TaxID=38942 RepID=UPI0021614DBF|nr:protein NRT1/ PTR FAMILY 5.5-like isoform X2 [Quercus robur]
MASFVRITVLIWADILTAYALFVMMQYLTNVWKLNFTHAAAIVNVFSGVATIMPVGMAFLVDAFMGDYWMLLLSSLAYSFGLSFLAMSTPHVLPDAARNCDAQKPDCIGDAQKVLFYTALVLIAIGISGHITSLESFLEQQKENQTSAQENFEKPKLMPHQVAGSLFVVLLAIVGCIALPYIKPWSVRFGIPAICTVVATFLFTTGSCSYKPSGPRPEGSPLTTVCRVFVASASKTFCHLPPNDIQEPYTRSLRCLDKAAIEVQTQNQEQIEQSRWKLCTREDVEDTKMVIRMIPMWMTFIMCGVVISIGNTYFLDQANDMNRKLGKLMVPLPIFKFFYDLVKEKFHKQYVKVTEKLMIQGRYVPPIGIFVAMLFSILCCITAASVETRRLDMIRRYLLLHKPNDSNEKIKIPMSMFWLLPQFLLLGAVEGMSTFSIDQFFTNQAPALMRRYLKLFRHGVIGVGTVGSVLSVYVVGKFSERGGRTNWFQDTLNKSRLDNYYWTLTVLSSINLFLYILVALQYTYRDPPDEDADLNIKE